MKLPARYILTSATIAAVAFALAASVTIYFWLGGLWGLGIYLITLTPIVGYAAVGGMFLDPTKTKDALVDESAPRMRSRILGMTVPLLASAVPCAALLLAWDLPATRAIVGSAAGSAGILPVAERALMDIDESVSLAGCEALTDLGAENSRDLMIGRLFESNDEALVSCLLNALPPDSTGNSEIRLQMLAARWEAKLWDEGLEPDRACALADHLRQAERAGVDMASPRLLICAVGAPEIAARQCCTQALRGAMSGAPSVASILPTAERATEMASVVDRGHLIIEAPKAADPEVIAMLGLDEPEYAQWSMGVGCESLRIWRAEVRERVGVSMARRLQSTCSVAPPQEETVGIWNQTCTEAATTVNPADFDQAICDGLQRRFAQEGIAIARSDLHRAIRIASRPPRQVSLLETMMNLGVIPPELAGGASGGGSKLGLLEMGFVDFDLIKNMQRSRAGGGQMDMQQFNQLMKLVQSPDGSQNMDPTKVLQLMQPPPKTKD